MSAPTAPAAFELEIPAGFFDEVAALLETEEAEEIADVVITVCTQRGILHPELDEEPDDELRAEEVREVFALLDAVTHAVADGTLVPRFVPFDDELDPVLSALWSGFAAESVDPESAAAVSAMLDTGAVLPSTTPP